MLIAIRQIMRYIAFFHDKGNQQRQGTRSKFLSRGIRGAKEERVDEIWRVHAWEFLFNFSKVRENTFITIKL